MKKFAYIFPLVMVAISAFVGFYLSPYMPDQMASHWGANGEVNGYTSKNFGLYFMPVLSLIMYGIFRLLPKIDPYKKNFTQFENYFNTFIIVIFSFLFYIYLLTLFWNLGYRFNMIQVLSPAFAVIFYYTGVLTSKAHRNWFVGIRTPWTMSSEIVWNKTHAIGGKLFKVVALLTLFGTLFPQYATFLLLIPVLATTIFVFAYSYWEYNCQIKK
jgi:uncharacterized membrane protein